MTLVTATVDLLSDTVTQPTPEMRNAMSRAAVGDDVYGEDPTVNRLEAVAAQRLGKEAAVFVPSGTMANLLAILQHCPRGRKVMVGDQSDAWLWEAGGAAVLGGVVYETVSTQQHGELALSDLEAALDEDDDPQRALPGLLCLENTHCMSGGSPLAVAYLETVQALASRYAIPVHLDGARLFNASVSQGVSPEHIARFADSVSFCLSKGLAAPVGSLVVGTELFARGVRRLRKMVGGGMRQAGIVAAAGIVALETMVERLAEDHANAQRLAQGLRKLPGIDLEAETPPTNIVFFRLVAQGWTVRGFLAALEKEGVRLGELGRGRIRAVTHLDSPADHIDKALSVLHRVLHDRPR